MIKNRNYYKNKILSDESAAQNTKPKLTMSNFVINVLQTCYDKEDLENACITLLATSIKYSTKDLIFKTFYNFLFEIWNLNTLSMFLQANIWLKKRRKEEGLIDIDCNHLIDVNTIRQVIDYLCLHQDIIVDLQDTIDATDWWRRVFRRVPLGPHTSKVEIQKKMIEMKSKKRKSQVVKEKKEEESSFIRESERGKQLQKILESLYQKQRDVIVESKISMKIREEKRKLTEEELERKREEEFWKRKKYLEDLENPYYMLIKQKYFLYYLCEELQNIQIEMKNIQMKRDQKYMQKT